LRTTFCPSLPRQTHHSIIMPHYHTFFPYPPTHTLSTFPSHHPTGLNGGLFSSVVSCGKPPRAGARHWRPPCAALPTFCTMDPTGYIYYYLPRDLRIALPLYWHAAAHGSFLLRCGHSPPSTAAVSLAFLCCALRTSLSIYRTAYLCAYHNAAELTHALCHASCLPSPLCAPCASCRASHPPPAHYPPAPALPNHHCSMLLAWPAACCALPACRWQLCATCIFWTSCPPLPRTAPGGFTRTAARPARWFPRYRTACQRTHAGAHTPPALCTFVVHTALPSPRALHTAPTLPSRTRAVDGTTGLYWNCALPCHYRTACDMQTCLPPARS